jgi:hypothetical protein
MFTSEEWDLLSRLTDRERRRARLQAVGVTVEEIDTLERLAMLRAAGAPESLTAIMEETYRKAYEDACFGRPVLG